MRYFNLQIHYNARAARSTPLLRLVTSHTFRYIRALATAKRRTCTTLLLSVTHLTICYSCAFRMAKQLVRRVGLWGGGWGVGGFAMRNSSSGGRAPAGGGSGVGRELVRLGHRPLGPGGELVRLGHKPLGPGSETETPPRGAACDVRLPVTAWSCLCGGRPVGGSVRPPLRQPPEQVGVAPRDGEN